jgi:hypothetical protein
MAGIERRSRFHQASVRVGRSVRQGPLPAQTCRAVSLLQTGVPDPTSRRIGLMLADELDYVAGVDTHRDEHTLVVVVVGRSPRGRGLG